MRVASARLSFNFIAVDIKDISYEVGLGFFKFKYLFNPNYLNCRAVNRLKSDSDFDTLP